MKEWQKYACVFWAVLLVDQVSKWLVLTYLPEPVYLTTFLAFAVTYNRGISWGLLHQDAPWLFIGITAFICMLTIGLMVHAYKNYQKGNAIYGELLIISGSIANIIDRIVHHGVVDFMVIHLPYYTWPVFNIADIAIVFGVFIMFVQYLVMGEGATDVA